MSPALAYFLTFSTYGTWLHGDKRGSVDRDRNVPGTPFVPDDPSRRDWERRQLRDSPYWLDELRRSEVVTCVQKLADRKSWRLWAVHVRSNHVHVIVTAPGPPERVMNDIKTAASRQLNKLFLAEDGRKR